LILGSFLIIKINIKERDDYVINWESDLDKKIQKHITFLINAKLNLNSLGDKLNLPGFNNNLDVIIFYYSDSDCGSCVMKGYDIIKYFDSHFDKSNYKTFIIACKEETNNDAIRADYFSEVFIDSKGILKSELKHLYTPFLLHLDSNKTLKNAFSITSYNKESSQSITGKLLK
jgi:hypothetical protein